MAWHGVAIELPTALSCARATLRESIGGGVWLYPVSGRVLLVVLDDAVGNQEPDGGWSIERTNRSASTALMSAREWVRQCITTS